MNRKKIGMICALFFSFFTLPVYAHCPLCTGAVGAAAISASYLGVDGSIIGVFIGGFAISTGLFAALKLKRQLIPLQKTAITLASFFLTVVPLSVIHTETLAIPVLFIGVYFVEKIIVGSFIGAVATVTAYMVHMHIKSTRGSVLFPYQGVVLTTASLVITGALFYVI